MQTVSVLTCLTKNAVNTDCLFYLLSSNRRYIEKHGLDQEESHWKNFFTPSLTTGQKEAYSTCIAV